MVSLYASDSISQYFVRLYLFVLQLAQIPLIAFGRIPAIKRNKLAGNIVFWLGLYAGFPLLCVAYVAY
jgi:sterol O-acyltransferase